MTTRRRFAELCAGATLGSLLQLDAAPQSGPAQCLLSLNRDWWFGKNANELSKITLPHCVAKLSWQDWNPALWEQLWAYRRHFSLPSEFKNKRVFLRFDGVMVAASPTINGHALPRHLGGYLPFQNEITSFVTNADNVLDVTVDSRWTNVPPEGSPRGPISIDYLEPGGILRDVRVCAVPHVFIADVFAKPVDVLEHGRRVEVLCSIDAAVDAGNPVRVRVELKDGARVISRAEREVKVVRAGRSEVALTLSNFGDVALWNVDAPHLYEVVTTLLVDGKPVHDHRVRTGFREARFDVDGFFLNGRRLQLFGLNRHELFPYVGAAMPRRVLRRDAEILRREFNCNIVRCSHYPQSEAFLDACDELGLMVWEEIPGWQYIGDAAWRELAVRDVEGMVRRDRNHPAIVIWGVRINESKNDPALYEQTRKAARTLDDSRPTSGSMTPSSTKDWERDWHQDVFAFDDYHAAPDGSVAIREPLPGVPYMLAEAVGQFNYSEGRNFNAIYRRAASRSLQQAQAMRHAQAHDRAMGYARCSGVIAWCAFDYGSLVNSYRGVKYPGVADVFRIPKLGAAFYQAQVDPRVRPVIAPDFCWDFGEETPAGPGRNAAIFSNCDRLEIKIDGKPYPAPQRDRGAFPHLAYPPFICDLGVDGAGHPELRIDGYLGDKLAISRSFSSDRTADQFVVAADDPRLIADGSDATRLVFMRADRFGSIGGFDDGEVKFEVNGPGVIVGDNPFQLSDAGGVGAVWIKTLPGASGTITVMATHSRFGRKTVSIEVTQPRSSNAPIAARSRAAESRMP